MIFSSTLLILMGLALLISSIGFYKYVYFISLGYGFSIAGLGIFLSVWALLSAGSGMGALLCSALLIVYGFRLGGYLLIREVKSGAYNSVMKTEIKDGKTMPFGVKCAIWITCALLYVLQVLPVYYRLFNGEVSNVFTWIGAAVMAFGLIFETLSDMQKQAAKRENPKRFCDKGLYRIVRCPNYLGEMIFWTGVVISGIGAVKAWQWIPVLVGYAGIIFVMFSGARRLELRQNKNYGSDPEYQNYVKTVPILLPFVPLYSVEKYKFLIA